jgi:hypothetical protein
MIIRAPHTLGLFMLASASMAASVNAQGLAEQQEQALKEITQATEVICYTVQQQGQESSTKLSGEVDAKLSGVIARVADLGVKGSGDLNNKEYQGVMREELASTLKTSVECRKEVFAKLEEKMLPTLIVASPPAPTAPVYSSGRMTFRGTWLYDLDRGTEVNKQKDADLFWEQVTGVKRLLVPLNGAQFSVIGGRDYDSISYDDLKNFKYSTEKIDASVGSNRMPEGWVMAYKTKEGRLGKLIVVQYGYDLRVLWTTFK